jgi:septum formation protein
MNTMPPLILASNSPRRKELLSLTGMSHIILPVQVDETPIPGEEPKACVLRLAKLKAKAAQQLADSLGFPAGQLILAADTIVVNMNSIYGKPVDDQDAHRMLMELRGHTHVVMTAISITGVRETKLSTVLCETKVPMRNYSEFEVDEYIKSGDPSDKAGAYAIQHDGFHPVESMAGCYASVMGLPLCHLVRELGSFQVYLDEDIPTACQAKLNYQCPVFLTILTRHHDNQEI